MAKKLVETTNYSLSAEAPACPDRRSDERYVSLLRVGAMVVEGRRELCLIRNISAGGLMAHVYSKLTPGQPVTIELKATQRAGGHVVWVRDANAGIQFE